MSTNNHDHEDHITPPSVYAVVLVVLFVLTAVTVYSVRIDVGMFNIVIAMVIASIKASIVALYFMHLKYEDKLTWIYAFYPLFLLFLLILFSLVDPFTRVPVVH